MTKPVVTATTLVTEDGVAIDAIHLPGRRDLAIVVAHGFTLSWQRPGDDDRPGGREAGQVLQLGQAVLASAEERGVARERRVERVRGAGVGADGLHADADDRGLFGKPSRAVDRDAGRVRSGLIGVQEGLLAVRPRIPTGPV